jgi:hypothetical protein
MRNMAAMIGSRMMDRYPTLRVGTRRHDWRRTTSVELSGRPERGAAE